MKQYFLSIFALFSLISCGEDEITMPLPRSYFRIDLPAKSYRPYSGSCPYTFEYPAYSTLIMDTTHPGEICWANLDFAKLHAKIHLSYKTGNANIKQYLEDSRNLAYKHAIKASQIDEFIISKPDQHVYGIVYEIGGNAASSIQFHVTDSSRHFLRGALYFYASPNADSLAPVISFVRSDIDHLLKTFKWKHE
jgi:gliding motility-associated lipoprotein GldD